MAPSGDPPPWTCDYDTLRRQSLFQKPPTDETAYPTLAAAIKPHVESFNNIFADRGQVFHALRDIGTKTFFDGNPQSTTSRGEDDEPLPKRNKLEVQVSDIFLEKSVLPPTNKLSQNREILPVECRERHVSYRGRLRGRFLYRINGGDWKESVREFGQLPIMLRSNRCHLEGLAPSELVNKREETEELGGYFIVNGIEKLIRMLIVSRRNYPMAIIRPSFVNRGSTYTKFGIQIRSVRPDQTSQTNVLHYLSDGNVIFRFSWRKNEFLVPVMMVLKALADTNDREIYEGLVGPAGSQGIDEKQFVTDRVELLLRTYRNYDIYGKVKTRSYLGSKFRVVLGIPEDMSDEEAGTAFIRKIVLPHLGTMESSVNSDADKFRMLLFMTRKLYALVESECAVDNPDAVQNQEILLPGFLYGMILKEKIDEWLLSFGNAIREWGRTNSWLPITSEQFDKDFNAKILRKTNENLAQGLEYFLSTGNLVSPTGLDLQQTSGFTVVAEKINFYRFISHFRMVHRGSFFAQLKTTTVRKLLPESWGFLCPVHTPDGAPCGLLNHLSHKCIIATRPTNVDRLPTLISQLGLQETSMALLQHSVCVQLDGRILGFCSPKEARKIADTLRYWKVEGKHEVPLDLEIGYIPNSNGGQYPGLYLFSGPARMYRPVKYTPLDKMDYVGAFEQPYLSIACSESDLASDDFTHVEYDPTNLLSIVANQTPFSDYNQSPRVLYQCLSVDHEVLTTNGWTRLASVRIGDEVMTMNLETGVQEWNIVEATIRKPHSEDLHRLKSGAIDAVCDASHRWYLNTKDDPDTWTPYTTQDMMDTKLVALRSPKGKNMGQWDRKSGTTTHINHKIPTVGRNRNSMYLWPDCSWLPRDFVEDEASNLDWCRLIGFLMGDGGIRHSNPQARGGGQYYLILCQSDTKADAKDYLVRLLERLAAGIPGFTVRPPSTSREPPRVMNVWTINQPDMYKFFLPMIRGPPLFDPLNDDMCKDYQAPNNEADGRPSPSKVFLRHTAASGNDGGPGPMKVLHKPTATDGDGDEPRPGGGQVISCPPDWHEGDWWYLRRWFFYTWIYRLSVRQARAIIEGMAVANGEWSTLVMARMTTGGEGRGGGGSKRKRPTTSPTTGPDDNGEPLINRGCVRIFNSSIPLMHDLSILGLLAETRVSFGVNHKKGEFMPSIGCHSNATGWRISFAFAESELAVAAPKPELYTNPRHDGYVYCLTVPNGNFMARRMLLWDEDSDVQLVKDPAQKPFFTGNCQMAKQTMGTPGTALKYRTDNKTYRLQTGQTPVVRPPLHNEYGLDNFPNGTNAVVAVISYTGYDMDDAMIINKSAHERGFGHGTIYKTKKLDLTEDTGGRKGRNTKATRLFGFPPDALVKASWRQTLDDDGIIAVGTKVKEGDIIAASHTVTKDPITGNYVNRDGVTHFHRYKDPEEGFVEEIKYLGTDSGAAEPCQTLSIRIRLPRSPVIGDKFSSRHGQKGVCSQKWPAVDMPFSESGIQPDVIINPHAFPSRMTIGMFIESLAGKAGCLHGLAQDSTPFRFGDVPGETAADYFGHQLKRAGFNYHGNEPMYSGITGQELGADIYVGVVYYQRLRHMVNDKFQVRTTGPVTALTGQPIKGRAKGGGIRVGEMERDSLIAHGASFLLQDRLMNCSDYSKQWLCRQCGGFLAAQPIVSEYARRGRGAPGPGMVRCRRCSKKASGFEQKSDVWTDGQGQRWVGGEDVTVVAVPGVLRFLDVELAAMGVKLKFEVEN